MGSVLEFPSVKSIPSSDYKFTSKEILLDEWKERNQIIADTFNTMSVFEKKQTIDVVLLMNDELYEMCLELKAKLKEKGID